MSNANLINEYINRNSIFLLGIPNSKLLKNQIKSMIKSGEKEKINTVQCSLYIEPFSVLLQMMILHRLNKLFIEFSF